MIDKELTIAEHIGELRKYLLQFIIISGFSFIILFSISPSILNYILNIFKIQAVVISPIEYINMQVKIALALVMVVVSPIAIFLTWKYIKPTIPLKIAKAIKNYYMISVLLVIIGLIFGFYVFSQYTITFFKELPSNIIMMWSLENVLNYIIFTTVSFALIFQIPLIVKLLNKIELISKEQYKKARKYLIVIILTVSAYITPSTDAYSQIIMACPMYLCYEVGILFCNNHIKNKQGEKIWQ